jgi:hypothetical protein
VVSEVVIPQVRHLRVQLRQVRRTHSNRTLGELLTDVYLFAFLGVLYGGSAAASIRRHLARPPTVTPGSESARAWMIVALLAVTAVLAWRGLRLVGPLLTTPAAQAWCVSTPIDRADWLATPMWWLLGTCAVAGAAVGVLAAWAGLSTLYGWAALAGAASAVALAAAAVVVQSRPGSQRRSVDVLLVLAVAGVAAAVANRAVNVRFVALPAIGLAAAGVVAAGAGMRYGWQALARIDRTTLAGGAQLASAAMSAAVMLDPSLLSGLIAARRWRHAGRVHSWHWRPGGRLLVLLQADVRRQWRRRGDLFAYAALILAPYAVGVFAPAAVGSIRIVAGYLAAERLAGGLRTVARTPALRRILGGTDGELKSIHLVVPSVGLGLWWAATAWAGAIPARPEVTAILLAGTVLAVYRTATRKPVSYDGGVADTPFGPISTNLLRQTVRGPDLVAVLVLIGFLTSGLGR